MKETTTRLTSSRYLGLQSFRGAWQRLSMMLLTLVMAFTAQTAEAVMSSSHIIVNITGSGTVTLTHSSGTDVAVTSGTSYNVSSGEYTLKFLPTGNNIVKQVTYKSPLMTSATDITSQLIDIDGGKSFTKGVGAITYEYNVIFAAPDAADLYTLTGHFSCSGYTMTFSVGGETVTAAEEGQRVDVTLPDLSSGFYWVVSSHDVSPITRDDALHYHFTMPANNVTVNADLESSETAVYYINDKSTLGHVYWSGENQWGYFLAGDMATLTVEPYKGCEYKSGSLTATNRKTGAAIALTDHEDGTWTFTMPASNVDVTATFIPDPSRFEDNGDGSYTIKTATGWNVFCDLLADNDKGYFSGKTVKLGANIPTTDEIANGISVTRMAGSSSKPFTGTFNGQGNTLTVDYSGSSYVAPFSYVDGATIQNLVVEGTISSTGSRAAGVIGETGSLGENGTATSHITNCVSSSTIGGGNYTGGFSIGGNVEIEGCVFNGTINSGGNSGGFVGYSQNTLKITNSLFAPKDGSSAKGTFYYNGTAGTLTNSYYTQALGDAQGTKAIAVNKGYSEEVTLDYSTSGIKMRDGYMERDGMLYAPDGASVTVGYVDETGTAHTHSATVLGGGSNSTGCTQLPGGWYVAGCNVNYGCGLDFQNADTYLILADNASLNITSGEAAAIYSNFAVTIYAQANGTGSLTAKNNSAGESGIHVAGNLIINGGTINAQSPQGDIRAAFATLNGGTVNATSKGISTPNTGNITLAGAIVTANGYGLYSVTVADGLVYADGSGHYYAGTLSADEKTAIAGKTISPVAAYSVSIADGITNGSVTVARSYAAAGENVILTVTPNTYYTVESVSYNDGSDHTITPVGDVYSFVMPAADVTVSATFSTSISFFTETEVSYIDADGVAQTAPTVNLLTSTSTELPAGWYMAASDVTIGGDVLFGSDIHLILKDGVTLTINGKLSDSDLNSGFNNNIVIYRQSVGTGCLTTSGIWAKTVTINGGVVTSAAGENDPGIIGNDIVINGGQVTATATGEYGTGIVADNTITLGYSRADDFVHATSFNPVWNYPLTITIKDGQTLTDGTTTYTDETPSATLEALTDVTLRPFTTLTLADNADNSSTISNWNGGVANVTLSGRKLWKDGDWNTLCLPFNVTLSGSPLAGAVARPLTSASISGTTMNLNFGDPVSTLVAGTPYIIKWTADANYVDDDAHNIVNPVFEGVTVDKTELNFTSGSGDTQVSFLGTYKSNTFDGVDKSILFLGANNTLYYPESGASIGACRAYFKIGDGDALARQLTAFNLDFGDSSESTGIREIDTDPAPSPSPTGVGRSAWYSLDGRKLDGKPTKSGVYIREGKKVVIK